LQHAYAVARTAAIDNRRVEPAAEWLIDNVYLIRNEIREIREALPPNVWKRLPRNAPDGQVVPRMLRALRACIAQGDGNVEPDAVERYLDDYQAHATFDLVELYAAGTGAGGADRRTGQRRRRDHLPHAGLFERRGVGRAPDRRGHARAQRHAAGRRRNGAHRR